MAKTDFLGGIILFGIMFVIALIELFVVKKAHQASGKGKKEYEAPFMSMIRGPIACKNSGGSWNYTIHCCDNCPKCSAGIINCGRYK